MSWCLTSRSGVGGEGLEVHLENPAEAEAAIGALAAMCEETPVAEDGLIRMELSGRSGAIAEAVRRLDHAGIRIEDIGTRRPTLDDVFI